MSKIFLVPTEGKKLQFDLYESEAPQSCKLLTNSLPFVGEALQARLAGEEFWIPKGPNIDIPPENPTIHLKPGEIGIAPSHPRNKVGGSIAIVYGEATLYDCVNVVGKVAEKDLQNLKELGESIWKEGKHSLAFSNVE